MPENQLQLLVGGIFTGLAGVITAVAVLVRAMRPASKETQVARQLMIWLDGEDIAGMIPRDLFREKMTAAEIRDAYAVLEQTPLLDRLPARLRHRVDVLLDGVRDE